MTARADAAYLDAKLCIPHRERAKRWRDNFFNPHHPCEPGGGTLMDSRLPPTGADLPDRWDRLNAQQIELIAGICEQRCAPADRRGVSPMRVVRRTDQPVGGDAR